MTIDIEAIEELCLLNYTAISLLERFGVSNPNLEQIQRAESAVVLMAYPKKVTVETIKHCVGENELASLFLYFRNRDLCE